VSQAKSGLSRYLNDVQKGETVLIYDRDRLVARLEPARDSDLPGPERIAALVRSGAAAAPRRTLDADAFLALPRPTLRKGVSATREIARERDER